MTLGNPLIIFFQGIMTSVSSQNVGIDLKVETEKAIAGNYSLMMTASLLEKDHLVISLLYPQLVKLDVPTKPSDTNKIQNFQQLTSKNVETFNLSGLLRDIIRITAIAVSIILVGYLIYRNLYAKINQKNPSHR